MCITWIVRHSWTSGTVVLRRFSRDRVNEYNLICRYILNYRAQLNLGKRMYERDPKLRDEKIPTRWLVCECRWQLLFWRKLCSVFPKSNYLAYFRPEHARCDNWNSKIILSKRIIIERNRINVCGTKFRN